jgi:organic hydroperoxide reductase OsmC/OhrA
VKEHRYQARIEWTGNRGPCTTSYTAYGREYTVISPSKPAIPGSSDPAFRGDPTRYNPEELLVASLSSCHMLWYLHLCASAGVIVLEYHDDATGTMEETPDGSGAFTSVQLNPLVKLADHGDADRALALHHEAHEKCFIARSVNFPVNVAPELL